MKIIIIAEARAGIPLPTVFESALMILTFEILREAGTRLPKQIGQAVSIVGALVLGESAINARLVSAPMVIVTASIIIRIFLLCLSATLGLFGYTFGIIGLTIYLFSIKSFGVNYMEYSNIFDKNNTNDSILRKPMSYINRKINLLSIVNYKYELSVKVHGI